MEEGKTIMVGRRNKDDPTKDPPIALGEVGVEKEHAVFKTAEKYELFSTAKIC